MRELPLDDCKVDLDLFPETITLIVIETRLFVLRERHHYFAANLLFWWYESHLIFVEKLFIKSMLV